MNAELISKLQAMRPQIRERWEALLRVERLHTPLANPDTLVYMFDQTLDEVLAGLPRGPVRSAGPRLTCQSKANPMQVYFPAMEQALLEALIHAQAGHLKPEAGKRRTAAGHHAAVTELRATLRRIARREIAAFDKLCEKRNRKRVTRA